MKYPFPATIRDLLDERMETGGYATEDDVLLRALQSLKEYDEDSLAHDPKRWPLAPEHETLPLPLRQITCGAASGAGRRIACCLRFADSESSFTPFDTSFSATSVRKISSD